MSNVMFECHDCGNFGVKFFGSVQNPSCPQCQSKNIGVECDEDYSSNDESEDDDEEYAVRSVQEY